MFLLRQDQSNVNQYDRRGWTPFQNAVDDDDVELVSYMLENNEADLMKRTKRGNNTIFHLLASKEMFDILISKPNGRESLEKVIDETETYRGWTALHKAAVFAARRKLSKSKQKIETNMKISIYFFPHSIYIR